ncbi:MAG: UPF0280 family protein [Desulfobacterales bacterium]|nr:UPF0280 family protein [Desulfobacterales bacterium]
MKKVYKNRSYRSLVSNKKLQTFRVAVKETDLLVRAETPVETETTDLVLKHRTPLERYIEDNPDFVDRLTPLPHDPLAPPIVRTMIEAGQKAGVGPMAAVAGAVAEHVGRDLFAYSKEVIIENGGDIFIRTTFPVVVAIFAGSSPLSAKLGVRIDSQGTQMAVCTSSGTLGHSLSLGRADAAVVISESSALADAAATAIGNVVSNKADIASAIRLGEKIDGVAGIVLIINGQMGLWGKVELVRLPQN